MAMDKVAVEEPGVLHQEWIELQILQMKRHLRIKIDPILYNKYFLCRHKLFKFFGHFIYYM